MKRYKLFRGSMHEDDNGKYVLYDDIFNLFVKEKWKSGRYETPPEKTWCVVLWFNPFMYDIIFYEKNNITDWHEVALWQPLPNPKVFAQ